MSKLSNLSDVILTGLKDDIVMLSIHIFQAKEEREDIGADELHDLASYFRKVADDVDLWANNRNS